MQDETLFAKRIRIGRLYDVYGSLLTVRQQKMMTCPLARLLMPAEQAGRLSMIS